MPAATGRTAAVSRGTGSFASIEAVAMIETDYLIVGAGAAGLAFAGYARVILPG